MAVYFGISILVLLIPTFLFLSFCHCTYIDLHSFDGKRITNFLTRNGNESYNQPVIHDRIIKMKNLPLNCFVIAYNPFEVDY